MPLAEKKYEIKHFKLIINSKANYFISIILTVKLIKGYFGGTEIKIS